MNTAVSPTLLVKDKYARLIQNIIPNTNQAGSGAKRYGVGKKGDPLGGGAEIVDVFEYRKSDGTIQFLVAGSDGTVQTFDENTGTYTTIKSGLDANGTIGAIPFNNKLVFWNGIDPCFSWDGSNAVDLGEWVTDALATSPTQVDTDTFTIIPNVGRTDYANGVQVRVTFASSGAVTATVASVSGSGTITVNVSGTPFPGSPESITKVEYFAYPPAFSFMFVHLDMLWGLSPGELKAKIWRGHDGMKAWFQAAANNENSWYDPTEQEIPYVDLTNKALVADELVGMSSLDGAACFHGRVQLYIYAGKDPTQAGGFTWQKTIPVGTVHQKLIQRFPGDTLFMTPYGARSLRRVFQTEEAEVVPDLGSDIDPAVQAKIRTLLSGDTEYRKARSFYYARDGLYGFKLDDLGVLVYVLSEESKGWVVFTGYFADARCFFGSSDGRLLVGRGSQLLAYANDTDATVGEAYSDDGEPIDCRWFIPWIAARGRWSNRAIEVLVEATVAGTVIVDRFIDYNLRNSVTSEADVQQLGAQWDVAQWDEGQFDGDVVNPVVSDKFLCDSFCLLLRHNDTLGPRSILGIRPIGR